MSSLSHSLRDTNGRLRFWLAGMVAGQPASITAETMDGLLSELLRAGVRLRSEPLPVKGQNPELDAELETYRTWVERLRELLPGIHSQLLLQRAQLESQRTRVQSAAQWARASRQTL